MRPWISTVPRGRAVAVLVLVAVVSASAGGAVAATRSTSRRDGIRRVFTPPRVSLAALQSRGLPVWLEVSSDERVLRLQLIRTSGRRITTAKTFRLFGQTRVRVRWKLDARTVARLRVGRYALHVRSGDHAGELGGAAGHAGLRIVGPRLASAPPPPVSSSAHASSATPCGVLSSPPSWQHVVWIVFENTSYSGIVGSSDAPYFNSVGATCGLATNFFAETHPSLPNYIAMTSGGTQGIKDDNAPSSHPLNVPSIFSQLGGDWRSLQESMTSNCPRKTSGDYAVKHDPAAYYMNIPCATQDVPLVDPPDLSARFTFLTPNLCHSMHDCSTSVGDTWLSQWLPKLLDSPQYQAGTTAIFITWDEDDHSESNQIPTFVVAPSVPAGTRGATRFDHYAMLRTTEEMLGLPPTLGAAAGAPSMRADFHL